MSSDEPFRLIREVEFEVRCLLHGKNNISFSPRPLNLGHGRLVVDLGRAICTGPTCNGSSVWLTVDLYETNFDTVPKDKWDKAMLAALQAEMGAAKPTDETEEVVESEPEPVKEEHDSEQRQPSAAWGPWGPDGRPSL